MTKRRYIINFVLIIVLGVVSGYFIGSYIAGSKLVALSNSYNELELRGLEKQDTLPVYYNGLPQAYFDRVLALKGTNTPDKISARELYMIAEYTTNMSDSVYKMINGNIDAKSMGIKAPQKFAATKIKKDGTIYIDKRSYGSTPVEVAIAFKVEHTIGEDTFLESWGKSTPSLDATFDAPQQKDVSKYRESWGSGIDYFSNYIITPSTVMQNGMSAVKKKNVTVDNDVYLDGLNYYEFDLALNIQINESTGEFHYEGVSNYMYEIKNTAGAANFPVFSYCYLHVVVDSNFRLVQIDADEGYQIIARGFNATTISKQTELFSYVR